ncbi:origin recognition complex subunit 1 [Apis florea]|uniref:origin recognition complex subunit 1 n=1 Tax=Apis florea TaxID=7463 RepID=UPI0006292C6B|nr:origin recognition complex subunit 1 [Apis florea]
MSSRLNKCSDHQILTILDRNSDNDQELYDNMNETKLQTKKKSNVQNIIKIISDVSSDTENVFQNYKYALSKNDILRKKNVSLKIKLRRSTEQSLYKIDTDSEYDNSNLKSQNRLRKQKRRNYLETKKKNLEVKESYSDSNDNSIKIETNDDKKMIQKHVEIENEQLRKNRNRRPPLKLSYYYCDTLNSSNLKNNSPSLRHRKNINYNENKLLINSIVSNIKNENKLLKQKNNETLNISNDKQNLEYSNIKNNKRNRIPTKNEENENSNTDIEILKTKSLKKSNKSKNINKLNHTSKQHDMIKEQNSLSPPSINSTPIKSTKQKRMICETPKKIQYVDNNNSNDEEECLSDMYKRIKISSEIKNSISFKMDSQKKMICGNTITNDQFVDKNNSDTEDECLSNMYKRIKISSAKKNNIKNEKNIESQQKTHLNTPKSHSIKCSNLTPSLIKRNNALLKPSTPLQEARSRLHVSAVPKSLPCREEEFNNIFTFLRGKLEDKSGGCIYISGVPGTGKTATVNEAIRCLQKLILKGQLDDFDYVTINGMKLTEPRQAYVQILKQLYNKTATWEQSYSILEKRFHNTTSKMTLLLVDELDFLCTKRQDVVYNLLDWPTKSTAQLIVVTIANTMDLPERVLMGRVTSRLGLTRLTFQPYNYKQLQEIVMSRLKNFNGFRSEAIQLVARKVSAVSGDARRALDICRRAIEIAESRNAETISLQDVTEAVSEMIASAKVQAIKHCSKMEQIFLQAVSSEVMRTSIEEVYFKDAYKQLESLCSFDGIEIPTVTEVLAICRRLGSNRLLICEHSRNDIYQKILLNVSTDDIHYAMQELDLN